MTGAKSIHLHSWASALWLWQWSPFRVTPEDRHKIYISKRAIIGRLYIFYDTISTCTSKTYLLLYRDFSSVSYIPTWCQTLSHSSRNARAGLFSSHRTGGRFTPMYSRPHCLLVSPGASGGRWSSNLGAFFKYFSSLVFFVAESIRFPVPMAGTKGVHWHCLNYCTIYIGIVYTCAL